LIWTEETHGCPGQADVTIEDEEFLDEVTEAPSIAPDERIVGTAEDVVAWLDAHGYTELETDIEDLLDLWDNAETE
jgi:hypothetical protein